MVWKKGESGNADGRPKDSKNKATLLKEERRAIFDAKASERWDKIIDDLIAKNPTYVADQFLGKSPDKVEVTEVPYDDLDDHLQKNNSVPEDTEDEEED